MCTYGFFPRWVLALSVGLAFIDPLTHVWIEQYPSEGAASTGFHIADDVVFLHSMNMFKSGFYSPFVSCKFEAGPDSATFFPAPVHWLYGAAGLLGSILPFTPLLVLGLANAAGALAFLLAAYLFLGTVAPKQRDLAFVLFALGGGLGGIVYGLGLLLGSGEIHEPFFVRFVVHELIEGPYIAPFLHFQRLYYTFPAALSLLGLSNFIASHRSNKKAYLAVLLIAVSAFLNIRLAVPTFTIALLYVLASTESDLAKGLRRLGAVALPQSAAVMAAYLMARTGPVFVQNNVPLVFGSIWFTPLLSAMFFHVLIIPGELRRSMNAATPSVRAASYGFLGYVLVFALLYLAGTFYWGNGLTFWDHRAAQQFSLWSTTGFVAGAVFALRSTPQTELPTGPPAVENWISLWLLLAVAVPLFAPPGIASRMLALMRFAALAGLPLAIVTAAALQRWRTDRPRLSDAATGTLVFAGMVSMVLSTLYVHGPLGRAPGKGPFAWTHAEAMAVHDETLMARLPEGRVLTPIGNRPPVMGDVLSLRQGIQPTIAFGSQDHGDQLFAPLQQQTQQFFSPEATPDFRNAFLEEWCVGYVYCPHTWPCRSEVVAGLSAMARLREIAREGKGIIFRVGPRP